MMNHREVGSIQIQRTEYFLKNLITDSRESGSNFLDLLGCVTEVFFGVKLVILWCPRGMGVWNFIGFSGRVVVIEL